MCRFWFDISLRIRHNVIVNTKNGFTLIELMLVMGIVMILSVVGIGTYMQATVKSRDTQRKSDLNQLSKAVEAFYNDVGRYPISDSQSKMYCVSKSGSTVTNTSCGSKLYALVDGTNIEYITIPSDPTVDRKYIYVSDGQTYAIYSSLENVNDKDLLKDGSGKVIADPWTVSCAIYGTVPCNYKITETGLIKSL